MSFLLDSILILNLSLNIFLKNKNLIAKFIFLSEVLRCFTIFELNKTALIHRNLLQNNTVSKHVRNKKFTIL